MDLAGLIQNDALLAAEAGRLRFDPEARFPIVLAKIKLTWRCNLRCRICAIWRQAGLPPGSATLTPGLVKTTLAALAGQGLRKVHFSGGEVLLWPGLEEVVRFGRGLGLQVNLTTNGTLLGKEEARWLVEARVHTVAFSLDAAVEKKHDAMRGVEGAWRQTWKGIRCLQSRKAQKGRGPLIAVNTVVTRKNIERLPEMHAVLKESGVEAWRLLPVRTKLEKKLRPTAEQWAWAAGQWRDWQPLLTRPLAGWRSAREARLAAKGKYAGTAFDEGFCYAPWFSLFLDADGEVYPCCTGRQEMPSYGSLTRQTIEEALGSRTRCEVSAGMASGHLFDVCLSCDEFLEENEVFARAAEKEVCGV
ncbi:MAG: radical SAM protein [Pseudomonadota bacterium]